MNISSEAEAIISKAKNRETLEFIIRKTIKAKNIRNMQSFAYTAEISPGEISKLLSGKRKNPGRETMEKLSRITGYSRDDLEYVINPEKRMRTELRILGLDYKKIDQIIEKNGFGSIYNRISDS